MKIKDLMYRNIKTIVSFCVLLILMILSQLYVYGVVHFESNFSRLLTLFSEVGPQRFLYITVLSQFIAAFSAEFFYIWILFILLLIIQWVTHVIPDWIAFICILLIYQFFLKSTNIVSYTHIFNNLEYYTIIGNLFVFFYSCLMALKNHISKKELILDIKIFRLNCWLVFRLMFSIWAIYLLITINYQVDYFYRGYNQLFSVIIQLVFMFLVLILNFIIQRKHKFIALKNIYSLLASKSSELIVCYIIIIPLFLTATNSLLIFEGNKWNTDLHLIILILILFTLVYYFLYFLKIVLSVNSIDSNQDNTSNKLALTKTQFYTLRILELVLFILMRFLTNSTNGIVYLPILVYLVYILIYSYNYKKLHFVSPTN